MNLVTLSCKNATVKWWRSFTLGFFVFAISFVMIISNSFIAAVKNKVEKVISAGITGHIQIRSDRSFESDMVEQYNKGWDALKPLNPKTIQTVEGVLAQNFPTIRSHTLVRQSAYITNSDKREETMLLGIDPDMDTYKEAFLLSSGRYLNPGGSHEILLTEEQAKSFHVKVGDTITISTKNRYGLNSRLDLEVVGVGNFIVLSLFSYKACYLHDATVRELACLDNTEATDLILFLPTKNQATAISQTLAKHLQDSGIETVITKGEILSSEDIQITKLDFSNDEQNVKVKLSTYAEMGQTFKSAGDIMFITLNIIVIFLMLIVSILIFNLVYMMGIERYREIGTMRAIGFSKSEVIRIFMGEILSITILSGLTGIITGTALIFSFGRSGIPSPIPALDFMMGKTLYLEVEFTHILLTILIFSSFSLAASFYPAYKACSIEPAESLRSA